jgi:DNA mismatch repair protein MutS
MYEAYETAYQHYTAKYGVDTAIFYLVGKFYELYDYIHPTTGEYTTSMKRATDILKIVVTPKPGAGPKGAAAISAGVPEQSVHKFAAMLTQSGWTVIIMDQVKDEKGNVEERVATRILTPGTHIEALEDHVAAASIAGIWLCPATPWGSRDPPSFGIASLDLTTGSLTTYESVATGTHESWTADDVFHFFQVHAPKEVLIFWRGQRIDLPAEADMRRHFGLLRHTKVHMFAADAAAQGALESPLVREDLLRRSIPVKGLLPFRDLIGIGQIPLVERALCALLARVEEFFPSGPTHLHTPEVWSPDSNLFLGNHALLQLNMISGSGSATGSSILDLFSATRTPMGARAMRRRILHPVADETRLCEAYNEIDAVGTLAGTVRDQLDRALRSVLDLPRLHRRITTASASATDILSLDQSYEALTRIAKTLEGTPLALSRPAELASVKTAFEAVFSPEKARTADGDAFCLQAAAAPEVAAIEAEIQELYATMKRCVHTLITWVGLPPDAPFRLEYRETLGPVVVGPKAPMTILMAAIKRGGAPFPDIHIQSKKSAAGLEIPHLDTLFRQILRKREALTAAVRRAMPPLCDRLTASCLDAWDQLEAWCSKVDVTVTLWRTSKELGFVRPTILPAEQRAGAGAGAGVELEGLRHPLIEASSIRSQYVCHDVSLGSAAAPATSVHGWLVYGMNASGKSSLMKAVGIAVLLAQAGCFVPASRMAIAPFRSLYTRILNTDNLWAGLSSFAVEMTELREILGRADSYSLVLGDELCSGTESVSATALVGAGLKWLHERRACFIFATHLHGLMNIPAVVSLPRL